MDKSTRPAFRAQRATAYRMIRVPSIWKIDALAFSRTVAGLSSAARSQRNSRCRCYTGSRVRGSLYCRVSALALRRARSPVPWCLPYRQRGSTQELCLLLTCMVAPCFDIVTSLSHFSIWKRSGSGCYLFSLDGPWVQEVDKFFLHPGGVVANRNTIMLVCVFLYG